MTEIKVTDEAVEAACLTSYGANWETSSAETAKRAGRKAMRAALESAASLLRVQVDADAVAGALHNYDMEHTWRDERYCPSYACMEIYPPRATAVLALLSPEETK